MLRTLAFSKEVRSIHLVIVAALGHKCGFDAMSCTAPRILFLELQRSTIFYSSLLTVTKDPLGMYSRMLSASLTAAYSQGRGVAGVSTETPRAIQEDIQINDPTKDKIKSTSCVSNI